MAYVEGLVSRAELIELVKRGWYPEPVARAYPRWLPVQGDRGRVQGLDDLWVQFFIDSDVIQVMTRLDLDNDGRTKTDEEAEKIVEEFLKGK